MSAAERRALRLTLFDDAAGGLNFRLSDQRSLALHAHQALGDGVLARWRAADGPLAATPATAADRRLLGLAMAEALFPAPVHEVLARQPGGWLHLQLAEALTGLPWEWAALPGLMATQPAAHLDERFTVVRQVMARGAPAASLRHRKPGALLQVLHALGALDESHHVDGAQLAEFDGAIAESPNQELFGQRDVLDACRTRQSLSLTQILLERADHTPNGRGLDGWGRSLLVDDARKTEIRHQPTQAQATPGGRRQLSWSRGRGASGGLAGASNHEIKLPRNRPQRPSHGSPYQADRGRLSYIQTECLRATPAPLRRRRFAVHDQTETAVHDR